MEAAIGAMASLFGGGSAAAGTGLAATAAGVGTAATAGTAAAAGLTTSGISSGILTALQGVSALLGVMGAIGQGQAQSDTLNQQAAEADMQSSQEQVQGQQRQNNMRRELARVLGQNDVTYAAAGIDLSSGIASDQAANAKNSAATEISIDQQDTEFRRALYRQRAQGLRRQAGSVQTASMLSALGTAADFGVSVAKRGVV